MLFDDHCLFRSALALLLHRFGLEVIQEGASGHAALRHAAHTPCDLILLDLELPDMDGLEAIRSLIELGIPTPVICLTMHAEVRRVQAALEAGARGYVPKSATPEELSEAIRIVMQGGLFLHRSVSHALTSSPPPRPVRVTLADRELEVVELLLAGYTNTEIGVKTNLSVSSVKSVLRSLFKRYGVEDRTRLAVAVSSQQRSPLSRSLA